MTCRSHMMREQACAHLLAVVHYHPLDHLLVFEAERMAGSQTKAQVGGGTLQRLQRSDEHERTQVAALVQDV